MMKRFFLGVFICGLFSCLSSPSDIKMEKKIILMTAKDILSFQYQNLGEGDNYDTLDIFCKIYPKEECSNKLCLEKALDSLYNNTFILSSAFVIRLPFLTIEEIKLYAESALAGFDVYKTDSLAVQKFDKAGWYSQICDATQHEDKLKYFYALRQSFYKKNERIKFSNKEKKRLQHHLIDSFREYLKKCQ